MISKEEIRNWFTILQGNICQELEAVDGKGTFISDAWERPGGGGGLTRILTNGAIIEKGGVNFSAVHGPATEPILKMLKLSAEDKATFFASGVSIVIHPVSPMVPIIHMNVRYFEIESENSGHDTWWFGGGIDLTPHYVNEDDARFFHQELKQVCDRHHPRFYPDFKKWADDYFFIKHRNETRGIGGIFFDYLKEEENFSKSARFDFIKDVGNAFAPIYTVLMKKNHLLPYTAEEKTWQNLRRGRYAEFNLVWDRGTKFGLETDGRTESILMSLPPAAQWQYNFVPSENTKEHQTLRFLKKGIEWVKL